MTQHKRSAFYNNFRLRQKLLKLGIINVTPSSTLPRPPPRHPAIITKSMGRQRAAAQPGGFALRVSPANICRQWRGSRWAAALPVSVRAPLPTHSFTRTSAGSPRWLRHLWRESIMRKILCAPFKSFLSFTGRTFFLVLFLFFIFIIYVFDGWVKFVNWVGRVFLFFVVFFCLRGLLEGNMDGVIFSFFLIFIDIAHALRYGIASNLQPYMWVTIHLSN